MSVCKVIPFKRKTTLGFKFKSIRIDKGYTLNFLSYHACIEPISLIHDFEEGVISLPLDHIYALANILEISPREVLLWIEKENSSKT